MVERGEGVLVDPGRGVHDDVGELLGQQAVQERPDLVAAHAFAIGGCLGRAHHVEVAGDAG